MRLHLQERPWDLFLVALLVTLLSGIILATQLGLPVAIGLVIFFPGYALVAALFPEDGEIDWIVRIALSFGLSLAVVPLLGLLLNFTVGIFLVPIVVTIFLYTIAMTAAAYVRRMRLPADQRLSATIELKAPEWSTYSTMDKALTVALVASLLFAGGVLAFVATTPRPGETFTEFAILGPQGRLADYPTDLNVSQNGTIIILVANHEFATVDYTVRVDRVGVQRVFNETRQANETVELNRTTLNWFDQTLEHDANWTEPYTFRIPLPGFWKVELHLFRDGDLATTYRTVHLFVTVT